MNSLLSYGYTILHHRVENALMLAGLTPFVGIIHSTYRNRPALSFDLTEEFRQVIVDRVVFIHASEEIGTGDKGRRSIYWVQVQMKEERFIFVAYDITNDQIRQKVSRRLIYYGLIRVQYSLFRGYLRLHDKTLLEEEIRALVNVEDKVHIIELCEGCKKRIWTIGDVPEVSPHLIL